MWICQCGMAGEATDERERVSLAELARLREEVEQLRQRNQDLEIALQTTTEHGDLIEAAMLESNRRLQAEVAERQRAQAVLQEIFEKVCKDKADLELILATTSEHGDALEYQLYTQAVEVMRQSEELFRAISESTPILMILTQRFDGMITYANSISVQRLSGPDQRLQGRSLHDFLVNPSDIAQMQALLDADGQIRNYEVEIKDSRDRHFWASASVHPLHLAGDQTWLTTLYDISDRKIAEAALRCSEEELRQQTQALEQRVQQRTAELVKAEEKYRSIFENAAEGIFQTTPQGRYISINPALVKVYGYDSQEDLISSVTDIGRQIYVQPRRRDELNVYLKQFGTVEGFESEVYRKDRQVIWVSENVREVRDEAGRLLYYEGSVRDITDRKNAEVQLREQRLRAERLLLNVLPQRIAERLKRGQHTIADHFKDVTVLFADIVDFTLLSSQISPTELVELLNTVFSEFDHLVDRYGLEKIKTIGDAYMVVGNLPSPKPDHVGAIAQLALAMQSAVTVIPTPTQQPLSLRIGIHSGPVIAGVIGTRKFIYDLWGDTVNVASRMESQGEPGRIQVTRTIYRELRHRFQFEERGPVMIKGKGEMMTYWLGDRLPGTS